MPADSPLPVLFDRTIEVQTADVRLHCGLVGEGPLVVCAHGFPDNWRTYREQIPALRGAGYQVASVSMRGYAPSSASRQGCYDAASLGRDLCAIVDALSPGKPVRLVGHDWGAVAAYAAAALRPDRFSQLVTMAVPHLRVSAHRYLRPGQLRRSWYMMRFQRRGVAERRVSSDDMALIDQLWRKWSPGYICAPEEMGQIKAAMTPHLSDVLGYYRALSSFRALVGESRRLLLARTKVPAMYLHGVRDGCIHVDLCDGVERAYDRGLETVRVPEAGHFLHLEQPELVNRHLLEFFG